MFHLSDLLALLFQAFLLRGCCEGARKLSASHGYALPRLSGKHREKEGAGLDVFGMDHKTLQSGGVTLNTKLQTHTAASALKHKPSEENTLVLLAKNGDGYAYSELCRRHSKRVFMTVRRLTKTHEDAEDVLQESLLKALIHLGGFDGRSSFSTWLTRIAINSALMMMRKRRNHPEQSIDWEDEPGSVRYLQLADSRLSSEEQLHLNEQERRVHGAIRKLPPKLRIPLELQLSEDVPVRELASLLGISVAATKSRLLRARIHLRRSSIKEFAPRLS